MMVVPKFRFNIWALIARYSFTRCPLVVHSLPTGCSLVARRLFIMRTADGRSNIPVK